MGKKECKKFYQVTKHTDNEITLFLQKNREEGLALKKVTGNTFIFEKKPYDGRKVCALTLYRKGHDVSTELQVREELVYLRSKGWDTLAIGKPETLSDSRRHVYLIEEIPGSEIPKQDEKYEKKAERRGKRKALSNLVLSFLLLFVTYFLFSHSIVKVVSSNFYIFSAAILSLFLLFSFTLNLLSFFERVLKLTKKPYLDISTRVTFFFLLALFAFLLIDSFLGEAKSSERVKIGSSTYKLYSDEIPLSLEDLGGNTKGKYRTTIKRESKSFLAEYNTYFDESFGLEEGETIYDNAKMEDISYVSYSIFSSPYNWLRKRAEKELYSQNSKANNETIIREGDSFIAVKSGFPLGEDGIKKISNLL